MKFLALFLIVGGEALSIFTGMLGARSKAHEGGFLFVFLKLFGMIIVGGGMLLAGYMFGFRAFKNIWVVSAISITSILIVEPLLAGVMFQQLPTRGAGIGLVLGVLGFIAAVFF